MAWPFCRVSGAEATSPTVTSAAPPVTGRGRVIYFEGDVCVREAASGRKGLPRRCDRFSSTNTDLLCISLFQELHNRPVSAF